MASAFSTTPTSYRLARLVHNAYDFPFQTFENSNATSASDLSLSHLCLLVFEAVLEVICVSLPGYIIARLGHFDADKQKFLANLNVMLFTPCLIFTKLASQLNADKIADLAIIPVIFVLQTLVSWLVSRFVAKAFRLNRRATNFVTAMGVFGNSNSLPISLILSLSQTIKGLHWDRIPGDNDDEVAARGILYLLIFQQLGQLVRWSWGYHVLLAPKESYAEYRQEIAEQGQARYEDQPEDALDYDSLGGSIDGATEEGGHESDSDGGESNSYMPAGRTPIANTSRTSIADTSSGDESDNYRSKKGRASSRMIQNSDPAFWFPISDSHVILSFPRIHTQMEDDLAKKGMSTMAKRWATTGWHKLVGAATLVHQSLPRPIQISLSFAHATVVKACALFWAFMNPPLWAMLFAIVVASTPRLQKLVFEDESFFGNSVTRAVQSNGSVAVPLILVVLGANLARNTTETDAGVDPEEEKMGNRLLVASLFGRMVLPTLVMAPILALISKYLPISLLDDPIFIVVCFLLTGAPSALQLAQICQLNSVYEKTMGRILFQSYVIW
ncbi:putative transporter [Escovopsis weberi]|uniref:Putative transporter n=1 Tax=Escovopsis weberi TaxID=150374 RepID=A0A0M9VVA4_ESCWE|nr:putative transporter [Escovopsis weberi]